MISKNLYRAFCLSVAAAVIVPCVATAQETSRFAVELEAGPVWQTKNDVQIPNDDSGTRFSLVDLAGKGPWMGARLYFTWNINDRHGVRALLAPLSYTETGVFGEPVNFVGESYLAGVPTEATYQFNSWRLTYRYRFHRSDRWQWWVGFTAKVRDAKIELRQGETTSQDSNVGFVPLLHVAGDWRFADKWHLLLDLDALAGGPGRAEDLALKVAVDVSDRLDPDRRLPNGRRRRRHRRRLQFRLVPLRGCLRDLPILKRDTSVPDLRDFALIFYSATPLQIPPG